MMLKYSTVVLGVMLAACSVVAGTLMPRGNSAPAGTTTEEIYENKCAACHGDHGQGAISLPRLPDFTDKRFQSGRTDKQLVAAITNGGDAMPAFGRELSAGQISLLAKYVRSFGGPDSKASLQKASVEGSHPADAARLVAPPEGLLERALSGQAHIYDLTYPISTKTPAYDGSQDSYVYKKLADIDKDGYTLGIVTMPEHFGTHIDAPAHFIAGKQTVDQLDPRRLIAAAIVIDVRSKVRDDPDYRLTPEDVDAWEKANGPIPEHAVIMLLTGWGERYWDAQKYRNPDSKGVMHFPGYSPSSVDYLVKHAQPVGLGIDTLSIDYGPSKEFEAHKVSLSNGLYHIENVANLDRLPARGAVVFVGPLPFDHGSGSPGRVLAIAP